MKQSIAALFSLYITVGIFSACEEGSIMDRSIYEDYSAAEVLSISETIPSFRFFYDNIRAKIVSKSNDYDKEQFKGVTYKSMYDLVDYWSSSGFSELVESTLNTYSEKMLEYQNQIDSISEHFRSIIDSVKVKGAPQFDFARIFKHPELSYIKNDSYYGFPRGQTTVSFSLPIRDLDLFNESGIINLVFNVTLVEKGRPNGPTSHLGNFVMHLYGDNWNWRDPKETLASLPKYWDGLYLDDSPTFMKIFSPKLSPSENFNKAFDWYYEVESVGVSYKTSGATSAFNDYLLHTVPPVVYHYWEAQEGADISMYIQARNNMIKAYVDEYYVPVSQTLPDKIESYLLDMYQDEVLLYQKVKEASPQLSEDFEVMTGRISVDCSEWMPTGLQLPLFHPNGNYVKAATYDNRIFREGNGPQYL